MDIKHYKDKLQKFADERNWEQFHSPKNLVMALTSEVGELNDIFQWLTQEESRNISSSDELYEKAKEELADIFIYLIRLATITNIDLEKAVNDKMKVNESKYPVNLAKDNAVKYNRR